MSKPNLLSKLISEDSHLNSDSGEESDSFSIVPEKPGLDTGAKQRRSSRIMTAAAFRTRKYSDKLLRFSKTHPHSVSFNSSTEGEGNEGSMPTTPTSKFFGHKGSQLVGGGGPAAAVVTLKSLNNRSCDSTDSSSSGIELIDAKSNYRIMVLGANRTGKTSIIKQFLYDKFNPKHKETVADDMYRGEFETLQGRTIGFDIQDVSGGYVYEFPGMMNVSLASADAFILVFSIDSNGSWEEVARLRDIIQTSKGNQVPIVVVANKSDLEPDPLLPRESLEATVTFDWENGYVESSASSGVNINKIFRELLQQTKCLHDFGANRGTGTVPPSSLTSAFSRASITSRRPRGQSTESALRRRQSLPAVPAGMFDDDPTRLNRQDSAAAARRPQRGSGRTTPQSVSRKNSDSNNGHGVDQQRKPSFSFAPRRSSLAAIRRDSCKIS